MHAHSTRDTIFFFETAGMAVPRTCERYQFGLVEPWKCHTRIDT